MAEKQTKAGRRLSAGSDSDDGGDETPPSETAAPRKCFVVSPIGSADSETRRRADCLLEFIIRPVATDPEFALQVIRADGIASPGMIDSQVINALLDAELVVADLSDLNANVFYEIGIRHVAEKPVIHMIDQATKIPFDVQPYRTIVYDIGWPRLIEQARTDLGASIREALSEDHLVDNPVIRARGRQQFEQSASPRDLLILRELQSIDQRVHQLERNQRVPSRTQRNFHMEQVGDSIIFGAPEDNRYPIATEESQREQVSLLGKYYDLLAIDPGDISEIQQNNIEIEKIRLRKRILELQSKIIDQDKNT